MSLILTHSIAFLCGVTVVAMGCVLRAGWKQGNPSVKTPLSLFELQSLAAHKAGVDVATTARVLWALRTNIHWILSLTVYPVKETPE